MSNPALLNLCVRHNDFETYALFFQPVLNGSPAVIQAWSAFVGARCRMFPEQAWLYAGSGTAGMRTPFNNGKYRSKE